jgi:hypothetical protein
VAHARRRVQHHLLACRRSGGGCIAVHHATGTLVCRCLLWSVVWNEWCR